MTGVVSKEILDVDLLARVHGQNSGDLLSIGFEITTNYGPVYGFAGRQEGYRLDDDDFEWDIPDDPWSWLLLELLPLTVGDVKNGDRNVVGESAGEQHGFTLDEVWVISTMPSAAVVNAVLEDRYGRTHEGGHATVVEIAELAKDGATPSPILLDQLSQRRFVVGEHSSLSDGTVSRWGVGHYTWIHDARDHQWPNLAHEGRGLDHLAVSAEKLKTTGLKLDADSMGEVLEDISNCGWGLFNTHLFPDQHWAKLAQTVQGKWKELTFGQAVFSDGSQYDVPEWFGQDYARNARAMYERGQHVGPLFDPGDLEIMLRDLL